LKFETISEMLSRTLMMKKLNVRENNLVRDSTALNAPSV
jgi:hypothetical protein